MIVEVDELAQVQALTAEVRRRQEEGWAPGLREVVPGARTLLLDGIDPARAARELSTWDVPPIPANTGPVIEIGCTYDGADLGEVARQWDVDVAEVVRIHTSVVHTVAFCGFGPGFAYLTGLGADRSVARRPNPRTAVPAGSVAVAGVYTGIYPRPSPGGWQLLGHTDLEVWDPDREPPALLAPGRQVRFVDAGRQGNAGRQTSLGRQTNLGRQRNGGQQKSVERQGDAGREGDAGRQDGQAAEHRATTVPGAPRVGGRAGIARVERPGALTTTQDAGRPGLAHLGVPRSGALDAGSHRLANRLVGNAEDAPVLETTLDGVRLRFEREATVAVTGAPARVTIDGAAAAWGLACYLPAGATLEVGPATAGVRSYLAVAGGFEVPRVLSSASTDLLSGLGPAPLVEGDLLGFGRPGGPVPALDIAPYPIPGDEIELAVRLGPRHDWLTEAGIATLASGTWSVSPESNRIALRLAGPPVERSRHDELASEGLVLGAIQSLPDGQLVVFLADHPTTGGYPVVAVVDRSSLGACAQARPGTAVRFRRLPARRR